MHHDMILVDAALSRRTGAARALVAHLKPTIRIQATRVLLADSHGTGVRNLEAEVDDLVQDVLLKLFADDARVLRTWGGHASICTWVAKVTRRHVGGALRYRSSNPWSLLPVDDDAITYAVRTDHFEDQIATKQIWQTAWSRLMKELSPRGRQLADQLIADQSDPDHVSAVTGLSMDAVYQWRSRIRRSLRRHVDALLKETFARQTAGAHPL